jgi:hypothetical protein
MMHKIISVGALLLSFLLIPAVLAAQSSGPNAQDNNGSMSSNPAKSGTSVTGCIQAGKKAGTFKLMGDDGTTYLLRSKTTNLSEHVGHTVTISGHVMNGETKSAGNSGDSATATGADQNASPGNSTMKHGVRFMVRSLSMVSDSCKASQ